MTARLKGAAAAVPQADAAPPPSAEIVTLAAAQAAEPAPPEISPVIETKFVERLPEGPAGVPDAAALAELPEFEPVDVYVPALQPVAAQAPEETLSFEPDLPAEAELPPLPPFAPDSFFQPEDTSFAAGWDGPQPDVSVAAEAENTSAELAAIEALIFGSPEAETAEAPAEAAVAAEEPGPAFPEVLPEAPAVIEYTIAEAVPEPEPKAAQVEAPESAATDPETQPEAKAASSEMAGRVVDAMMKTISTAIYAKPSASERAAFLREMASLMEQEAAEQREDGSMPPGETAAVAPPPPVAVIAPKLPEVVPPEPQAMAEALANRVGPAAALLKPRVDEQPDPFAEAAPRARFQDARPEETPEADEESGELAITLLDMMSGSTGSLPHERTLAADTLLRILPRIPVKQLVAVVERVAIMEQPPALLVAKLIRDPRAEVVCPLLERCSQISDQDLMNAAPDHDAPKLRMIARRRVLSTVLSDYLISTGDPSVLLILIRNPGAALSHDAFFRLADCAGHHHALLAPLTTRADLPPPVAFELFWHVPSELRRFIFSRFLTDSETLNKILRITLSTSGGEPAETSGEAKLPPREALAAALESAIAFRLDEAAAQLAELAGIARDTALRVLSDREGEPLTVLLKTLGCSRAKFEEVIVKLRQSGAGLLRADRDMQELQAIFDGLSFNKARILLTYWDWYVRKSGPYAPHN